MLYYHGKVCWPLMHEKIAIPERATVRVSCNLFGLGECKLPPLTSVFIQTNVPFFSSKYEPGYVNRAEWCVLYEGRSI